MNPLNEILNIEIKNKVLNLQEYINSNIVCFYVSFESEVQTHDLIKSSLESGKRIIVPYVDKKEIYLSELKNFNNLDLGKFGILAPKKEFVKPFDITNVEAIIIPGIVFDKLGHRIGFGGGYYDKLLRDSKAIKIALCYDFQLFEKIPYEEHDIPVDIIITEKQIIRVND